MGKLRAVVCGYYGEGNAGDEALLVSLLQMLPQQITPVVLSGNPSQTTARYGVESCDRRSVFLVLRALRNSHLFIWGGGSLMQDATSFASPFYYAGLMVLAQWQGLKTIAWAQGIGPLNRSLTRWITQKVLRRCTAVSVRDYASAQLLSTWQISTRVAPDPVWALAAKPVKGLRDLPAPRVAINLRRHPQLTPQRLAILTQALIDFQKATQTCLLLVPFQSSQDLAIARSIAVKLSGFHQILTLDDPRELKGLFRGVEMLIGMRYHSLIMAAAEGCRCFALSYDPKVTRLMTEVNLPGWELAEIPDDPNLINTIWVEHYANGKPLTTTQIQPLVDRALIHQELLQEVFQEL
jgi:polysaccharide pyruvyl transferase CsaB